MRTCWRRCAHSLADDKPIAWGRVNNLPDYVYFNHSIHVAKGVGCSSCHGQVDAMPLTYKAAPMTMQFCLNCHRNPGPQLRPESAIYDTELGAPRRHALARRRCWRSTTSAAAT